jgi:hypothetical protein
MSEHQPERRIALFQQREVRRTIHNNEWWFVITDVVANALKGGGQFAPLLCPGDRHDRRKLDSPMMEY